ncbi:MAG: right-handed parallel beta-helix repeat-containing protein [bacterium]|nr:right-handed parallel beta-helix repeat-containing protein [bacterium]
MTNTRSNAKRIVVGLSFLGFFWLAALLMLLQPGEVQAESSVHILAQQPTPPSASLGAPGSVTTLSGWITFVYGDPPPVAGGVSSIAPAQSSANQGGLIVTLVDAAGKPLAQLEPDWSYTQLAGQYVQVTGEVSPQPAQTNAPAQIDVQVITPLAGDEVAGPGLPSVSGSQPWVNVLCRFANDPSTPYPVSYYNGLFANSYEGLDHYWRQISYNTINLIGSTTTTQWVTLPHPRLYYIPNNNTSANLGQLAEDCTRAADSTIRFPNFVGINLMFNAPLDCCAWGGTYALNLDDEIRTYRVTWLPPWAQGPDVIAHEMGHGFGMPHSSGPANNPPTGFSVYVSQWDVMSVSGGACADLDNATSQFCIPPGPIAYHRELAGWIPSRRIATVQPGDSVTVTLERLTQPQSGSSILMGKIPINNSPTRFYSVEVRLTNGGYDQSVPGNAVVIHDVDTTRTTNAGHAFVVDADNNFNVNDAGARWMPGETFYDPANNIRIQVVSASGTTFTVRMTNNALPCDTEVAIGSITSLVNAINSANNNPDTNVLCLGANSTYSVTSINNNTGSPNGLPVIRTPIVIQGRGATITRAGNAVDFRLFYVNGAGSLTLNNVTVRGGVGGNAHGLTQAGGGVFVQGGTFNAVAATITANNGLDGSGVAVSGGTATFSNSNVTDNQGDGVLARNSGSPVNLTINGTTFARNGRSGIRRLQEVNLNVQNSIIQDNRGTGITSESSRPAIINLSCVVRNSAPPGTPNGINASAALNAESNWWGSSDGPSGAGAGQGDSVSATVDFQPFSSTPLLGCPARVRNDGIASAEVIPDVPYEYVQDISGATRDAADPTLCAADFSRTVWFRYTPAENHDLVFNTSGSDFDTVIAVYTGSPGSLTQVACNDDSGENPTSQVSFDAVAGTTYFLLAGEVGNTSSSAPRPLIVRVLDPTASIAGRVTDEAGTPLANIQVGLEGSDITACTNADGTYVLNAVPLGGYPVYAGGDNDCAGGSDGYFVEWYQEQRYPIQTVEVYSDVTNINFTLTPAAVVTGVVRDTNGTPLEDIKVGVESTEMVYTCTDENGAYTLRVPLGQQVVYAGGYTFSYDVYDECSDETAYRVRRWWQNADALAAATPLTFTTPGQQASSINFTLAQGGAIAGTVENEPYQLVCTYEYDAATLDQSSGPYCAYTDEFSEYIIYGVPVGTARVRLMGQNLARTFYQNSAAFAGATPVNVTAEQITQNINFTASPARLVSGRVFADDGTTPLPGVTVSLADGSYPECTDSNGSYTLQLPVGTHIIRAGAGICSSTVEFGTQYYNTSLTRAGATPVVVGESDIEGINFVRNAVVPPPLALTAPIETITNAYGNPTYTWTDTGAASYELAVWLINPTVPTVTPPGTVVVYLQNLARTTYCDETTCSIEPTTQPTANENARLVNGLYYVYLRTGANGQWQGPFEFTLNAPPTTPPTLNPVTGTDTLRPTFSFTLEGAAVYTTGLRFYLAVADTFGSGAPLVDTWYSRAQLCGSPTGTTCSLPAPLDLSDNTDYTLVMQGYGPGGYSAGGAFNNGWSRVDFTVDLVRPPVPQITQIDINQGRPTIVFTTDALATRHYVSIYNWTLNRWEYSGYHQKTGDAALVCDSSTCALHLEALVLNNGSYSVFVNADGLSGASEGGAFGNGFGGPTEPTVTNEPGDFVLAFNPPALVTGLTASSSGSNVQITWQGVPGATWYRVWVGTTNAGQTTFFEWRSSDSLGCPAMGTCTVSIPLALSSGGTYYAAVMSAGPGGMSSGGPVNNGFAVSESFTVP